MATRTAPGPSPVHPIPANGWVVLFGPLVDGKNIEVGDFTQLGPDSGPTVIMDGPDGALRFTEYRAHRIGRITTDGRVTEFSVPTPECEPFGIAQRPDGALWFTVTAADRIGRLTTGGMVTEFRCLAPGCFPR
ncbi:hypothetical protein ACH4A6_11085 [Streptomyces atroolivaceus]|uniref:Vgb family protein n=1 Tax=Streptomyces atroolivaceus TaxID=66869 RepID=UPI0037AB7E23